ncbi:transposase [Streptomyces sp. NPDC050315]|uniref:transposase n=1 Tax=Streptomyces sp. NPDC050315 TaxID=3155039 RepID=UPI0034238A8A
MTTQPWPVARGRRLVGVGGAVAAPVAGTFAGPKPVDDRLCLQGILYVLHQDIAWQLLPPELGFGSGRTCWRRLERRQKAGSFEQLHSILLAELNAAGELDWTRVCVDGSHVRAKKGDTRRAATPTHYARDLPQARPEHQGPGPPPIGDECLHRRGHHDAPSSAERLRNRGRQREPGHNAPAVRVRDGTWTRGSSSSRLPRRWWRWCGFPGTTAPGAHPPRAAWHPVGRRRPERSTRPSRSPSTPSPWPASSPLGTEYDAPERPRTSFDLRGDHRAGASQPTGVARS